MCARNITDFTSTLGEEKLAAVHFTIQFLSFLCHLSFLGSLIPLHIKCVNFSNVELKMTEGKQKEIVTTLWMIKRLRGYSLYEKCDVIEIN